MAKKLHYSFVCEDCQGPEEPCALDIKITKKMAISPMMCPFGMGECNWMIPSAEVKEDESP